VEFESRDDMLECIRKADGTELGGRKIRLSEVSGSLGNKILNLTCALCFFGEGLSDNKESSVSCNLDIANW